MIIASHSQSIIGGCFQMNSSDSILVFGPVGSIKLGNDASWRFGDHPAPNLVVQ